MMRRIRKLDLWRGYACMIATAMLLSGCSSDLSGPDMKSGTGSTGARGGDVAKLDDRLGAGRCQEPYSDTEFICMHTTTR